MKFAKRGERHPQQQEFDRKKITLTKAGETYNVYDAIQAANVDTDIYEVLKKYHCTTDQAVEYMQNKGGIKGVYQDIVELQNKAQNLADIFEIQQEAQMKFDLLPVEIKQKYGNNLSEFLTEMQKENKETEPLEKKEVKTDEPAQ